jgi:hypothetical protein
VIAKSDLLNDAETAELEQRLTADSRAVERSFIVSAVTGAGLVPLLNAVADYFLELDAPERKKAEALEQAAGQDAHSYSKMLREARHKRRAEIVEDDFDDDDDGAEVTVHYEP